MAFSPPRHRQDISALLQIMDNLRNPDGGCPWDLEQDFKSIAPYTVEEAYEVVDAIERQDISDLRDELGDLLLQVVFHAQMAKEDGSFAFGDVVQAICDKMVRRHPHVFEQSDERTSEEQLVAWEDIKAQERAEKGDQKDGLLDDVPLALPAMSRAVKLQKRAARVGFDWQDTSDVIAKIAEEASELSEAVSQGDTDSIEDEFGDLLFTIANLSRHLKVDPEKALRRTNQKFCTRFGYIEEQIAEQQKDFEDYTLEELEELWQAAKKAG
ncbi:nucleoside triphosphate pyrophosphohydrolase [Parvularcula sp. IMCC14364]|uniref:nucleoside triphosphate pyrophosphohydrolase n=1 Tax=Parvularcula sp. IMCC14364 TaxID=3067902 RepID=UPI002741DFEE|nr:nucleoside triphosphate pyrophosphohydrolase [Parvularcula sp. IMCC14364]